MTRFSVLALALLAAAASAQVAHVHDAAAEGFGCTLYVEDGEAVAGPYLPFDDLDSSGARRSGEGTRVTSQGAQATITVTYDIGFTPAAQAAFQRAVDIWANHIASPIEIRVDARFAPLASGVLGSAGPTRIIGLEDSQTLEVTWFPIALADKILGRDVTNSDGTPIPFDLRATFNSNRTDYYFGLDGNPGSGQFDFVTIVLHELGHGLGFVGSGDVDDGQGTGNDVECNGTAGVGCVGITSSSSGNTFPLIYDRFLEDAQGTSILNTTFYPNPSVALGNLFQSQNLFNDAPEVVRVYGARAPIYAPVTFDGGSSFSHWDEVTFTQTGGSAALMTPRVARGEAYQDPGNITCAFFKDMGWDLGAGCVLITTPTEVGPNDAALALEIAGPNPVRGATALRLRQREPGPVRVVLHDALGREVLVLADGDAGSDLRVRVEAAALAPGVYHVVARGEGGARVLALTVVR